MSNYTENQTIDDQNHAWSKILKIIPNKSLVLDVGCSSGNLGKALINKKDCTVDGVEIDEKDAKIASTILRKVEVFDISQTSNFKRLSDKYDAIIFADVLEHLVDPSEVLSAAKGLLKPGGMIVYSIPNMAHISIRLALLKGEFKHTDTGLIDKTHLHFYTEEEVRRIFTNAGLSIKNFDLSPYPYPERLIVDKLQALGLTPAEKALKMLQEPDAIAYQFVGFADIESTKKIAPILAPKLPIENDMSEVINKLSVKENELQKALTSVADYQKLVTELNRQIQNLQNSRVLRTAQVVKGSFRKLRKKSIQESKSK